MSEPENLPRVPAGRRVYAIGDIHGRMDLLESMLIAIRGDASSRPGPNNLLVFLGDYVDRGPDSARVLDRIGETIPGFESVRLLGNHEFLMREALAGKSDQYESWMENGAAATLRSYGLDGASQAVRPENLTARIPMIHRRLLDGLRSYHIEGDYFFAHAGLRPGIAPEAQSLDDLIWIRKPFLNAVGDFGKVVVHGHSVSPDVVIRPNRIGVDTGAYAYGVLSAVVLEGTDRRILRVGTSRSS